MALMQSQLIKCLAINILPPHVTNGGFGNNDRGVGAISGRSRGARQVTFRVGIPRRNVRLLQPDFQQR